MQLASKLDSFGAVGYRPYDLITQDLEMGLYTPPGVAVVVGY